MVSDGKSTDYASSRASTGQESFADVSRHLQNAREQASRYITAQIDRLKAIVRSVVLLSVLGVAAVAIGVTVVVTAVVLFCIGIADGISELLGGRQWAGDLIAGGAVLAIILLGGWMAV